MKLLLDTCAFLWALQEPKQLSLPARRAIENTANDVIVSAVSFWEISIKSSLGRLSLEGGDPADMPRFAAEAGFDILPLDPDTAATSFRLPRLPHHRDPFDRMLVWTALRHDLQLVSRDRLVTDYATEGLRICW